MFIFVAIAGLAFASCKKEDQLKPKDPALLINNESWHISKKGVRIGGLVCNELTNDVTGQRMYEPTVDNTSSKAQSTIDWEWSLMTIQGVASCSGQLVPDCYCTPQGDIIHKPIPAPTK